MSLRFGFIIRSLLLVVFLQGNISCTLQYGITDLNIQTSPSSVSDGTPQSPSTSIDAIAPTLSGSITDGVYYNSITQSPVLSWTAGTDNVGGSGISKYQVAIGTTSGGTQVQGWTDIGNVTSYQVSGLSLSEGVTYYPTIRVLDVAGNISTAIVGDGWIPDVTAPVIASVEDGDQIVSTSYSSWIAWPQATESLSGISNYEVRIVDSGNAAVTAWTNVGTVLGYGFTGLTLTEGHFYKAEVRATDKAGNVSNILQGNGWYVVPQGWKQQAYLKASNAQSSDWFGRSVSVSGDTIVVGADGEDSNQTTITNGTTSSSDNSLVEPGAVYVFKRSGKSWTQEAYLKAPNADSSDWFGKSVAISGDTIVVGASGEDSNQTTITNGITASADNSAISSGAAYVFKRTGVNWAQEAYLKASNAEANDNFGSSVSVSGDTVVVGAYGESSNQTTITNGTTASIDNSAASSGAAYVFKRTGVNWAQEAYLKAPNSEAGDWFGWRVAVSSDTAVVAAKLEDSNQTFITNGTSASNDNSLNSSGAVYVFKRSGTNWSQEAYLKAPNAGANDGFGVSIAISNDTVIVGADSEDSNQSTITNGTTASIDNSAASSGAAYVFKRTGVNWAQEAYLKASNSESLDLFGTSVSVSGDTVVVGADSEDSNQTTITNGATASSNNAASGSGAAYVFKRSGASWAQEAYLKAPNADAFDNFGTSVSVSGDTVVVGAYTEGSTQTTITNGPTASSDNSGASVGAAYVFTVDRPTGWSQQAYVKASNAEAFDQFGYSVAISGDTAVVGAIQEDSNQTTITNGTTASSDNSASNAGAVYVFKRTGTSWAQEAYIKASNAQTVDVFGISVAISGDTIVVGSYLEDSNQTTITNGTTSSSDNSTTDSGAAYVYRRIGNTWSQEAYLKASNAGANDWYGMSVAISGDTIVVGSSQEDSNQTTITNGTTSSSDNSAANSGAAYVYKRTGTTWAQEAYIKASNAEAGDAFGGSVAISGDTIVIGSQEDSNQTTITNGTGSSSNNSANMAGAAYVYKRTGTTWAQEAYLKAPNAGAMKFFGAARIDGDTIVIGSSWETSNQTTITNGSTASSDNSVGVFGAAYVFKRSGTTWSQEAYLKPSNNGANDMFGVSPSISGDTIVVGARQEESNQTTITNGTTASSDNSLSLAGAVYVFKRTGTTWAQEAYIKSPNIESNDAFGTSIDIYGDTIIAGAAGEDSNQTTITNGTTASSDNSASSSGAVYIFKK